MGEIRTLTVMGEKNARQKEVVVMAAIAVIITEGPGELDFVTALLRGGEVEVTVLIAGERRKLKMRISKKDVWDLSDVRAELTPGVWTELKSFRYTPRTRTGQIVLPEIETHPICGHPVPKGTRYCPQCGRDRMDVE